MPYYVSCEYGGPEEFRPAVARVCEDAGWSLEELERSDSGSSFSNVWDHVAEFSKSHPGITFVFYDAGEEEEHRTIYYIRDGAVVTGRGVVEVKYPPPPEGW